MKVELILERQYRYVCDGCGADLPNPRSYEGCDYCDFCYAKAVSHRRTGLPLFYYPCDHCGHGVMLLHQKDAERRGRRVLRVGVTPNVIVACHVCARRWTDKRQVIGPRFEPIDRSATWLEYLTLLIDHVGRRTIEERFN